MIRPADHLRGGWGFREDRAERNRMIRELHRKGERQKDIALAFDLTRTTVYKITREGAR